MSSEVSFHDRIISDRMQIVRFVEDSVFSRHGKLAKIDPSEIRTIYVIGDVHGDLQAFREAVSQIGKDDLIIFLGDYADRGRDGLEVIEGLMSLHERIPERVIMLQGNHEDFADDGTPKFHPCTLSDEVRQKGGSWEQFFPRFRRFIDSMGLAAIIPGFALLVHGGISDIMISRSVLEDPDPLTVATLLWSDPGIRPGIEMNTRGAGVLFGPDITASVLNRFGVRYLIRGHQPRKAGNGPFIEHKGMVVTTSGTSVYGGKPFALKLDAQNLPESPKNLEKAVEFLGTTRRNS